MRLKLDPRILTPTVRFRDADRGTILELARRLDAGWSPEPITCLEADGYFLIMDGHRRWAAHLLSDQIGDIGVELIDAADRARMTTPDAAARVENDRSLVRDWEAALRTRLLEPRSDELPGLHALTILSGPSGAGKSRIISELKNTGIPLKPLRTTTTRPKRANEVAGRDYDFTDHAGFRELVRQGVFCEWQCIHGNYYGSRWDDFFTPDATRLRIKDLDAYGALQLRSLYPSFVTTAFIDVADFAVLRDRIKGRGTDTSVAAVQRLSRARKELRLKALFDQLVVNDVAAVAADQVLRLAGVKKTGTQARPFYHDPVVHGHYVVLDIDVGDGEVLAWANMRDKTAPLLLLNGNVADEVGFRLLEAMVLDQLQYELQYRSGGRHILRELTTGLDQGTVERVSGTGDSRQVSLSVKRVRAHGIRSFIAGQSEFFRAQAELFPGFR